MMRLKKDNKRKNGEKKPKKDGEPLPTFEVIDRPEDDPPEQIETMDEPTANHAPKRPRKKMGRKISKKKK